MDVHNGQGSVDNLPVQPLDPAPAPPVQGISGHGGEQVPDRPGELNDYTDVVQAACSAGMGAENGRREGYQAGILPLGADYGDQMTLPPVPSAASPMAPDDYPKPGLEPFPQ